ncbi:replication-associated recombination protein A [Thermodesulfobacteriota bacterium]
MNDSIRDQGPPLAERMRPVKLEEIVGQEHLLGPDGPLFKAIKNGRIFSVIFWGPPGSGKTTLARIIGRYTGYPFSSFSAVISGVKELRKIIGEAEKAMDISGKPTLLFVDEIHRFNKAQQDAFLPYVESGLIILIGATTQNPSFEIIPPLLSRARVLILNSLEQEELVTVLQRALNDRGRGFGGMQIETETGALDQIAQMSQGDARVALNNLEIVINHATENKEYENIVLNMKIIGDALSKKPLTYDKSGEEHYNLISAFHKSLRGSDAQASLYWLYRMLMAGEDPLFIGRRMIRFASEDIGLADPNALQIAITAFDAWQKIGPPEAELALSQAAVYLASAPKSNALYLAEKSVKKEIETSGALPVPLHIRNAPTALMKKLGYSRGYLYPHNYPGGWVKQEYLPNGIRNRTYYEPVGRGYEREIKRNLSERKKS